MDKEFHYSVNYLIATKAGFASSDAYKIAYASQYVDDNYHEMQVCDQESQVVYSNTITQNYNITIPTEELNRIYPVYHFIPSSNDIAVSKRHDGRNHKMDTVPDNENAIKALHKSLEKGDLFWIGIASHAFVDSWSHQNFTGTHSCYNAIPGVLRKLIANIGHADAFSYPDKVGLIWHDTRLLNIAINNNTRFLSAAIRLLEEYLKFFKISASLCAKILYETSIDLQKCFGKATKYLLWNLLYLSSHREKCYKRLSISYSKLDIPLYQEYAWEDEALINPYHGALYYWRDPKNYYYSDWYLFQNAAQLHRKFIWPLITERLQ